MNSRLHTSLDWRFLALVAVVLSAIFLAWPTTGLAQGPDEPDAGATSPQTENAANPDAAGADGNGDNGEASNTKKTPAEDPPTEEAGWLDGVGAWFWESMQDLAWLWALLTVVFLFTLAGPGVRLVGAWLMRKAEQTPTPIDDILVAGFQAALRVALVLAAVFLAIFFFKIPDPDMAVAVPDMPSPLAMWWSSVMPWIVASLYVVGAAFLWHAVKLLNVVLGHRITEHATRLDDVLAPVVTNSLRVVVLILAVVGVLGTLGINVLGILVAVAIVLVLLILFGQTFIQNLVGAFALVSDRPFEVGDVIRINDRVGTVTEVGLRATRLATPDRSLLVIPNSKLTQGTIENLTLRPIRRFRHVLSLHPQVPAKTLERLITGIRDILLDEPTVVRSEAQQPADAASDPLTPGMDPLVTLLGFQSAGVELLVQYWVKEASYLAAAESSHRLNLRILALLNDLRIVFSLTPIHVDVDAASLPADDPRKSAPSTSNTPKAVSKPAPPKAVEVDDDHVDDAEEEDDDSEASEPKPAVKKTTKKKKKKSKRKPKTTT